MQHYSVTKKMKYFYNIFSILLLMVYAFQCIYCIRLKRSLVHPDAKVQFIFGVGIPVSLEDMSVTLGYSLRAFYRLPSNASDILNPSNILERKNRSLPSRLNIYNILANILERFGGKSCVLLSICELTSHNLREGCMEDIINYIFRPSITRNGLAEPMDREYIAAEIIGKQTGGRCKNLYPECVFSLVDSMVKRQYRIINND